jgi:hypothetical protein
MVTRLPLIEMEDELNQHVFTEGERLQPGQGAESIVAALGA